MQKKITELFLYELIEDICNLINLNISEWYLDKKLYEVILNSADKSNLDFIAACHAYDCCFNLSVALDIDVDPKYYWFLGLAK